MVNSRNRASSFSRRQTGIFWWRPANRAWRALSSPGCSLDGTAGLWAVKRQAGVALVQEPSEASYASMPESAIAKVAVDFALPIREIFRGLTRLAAP